MFVVKYKIPGFKNPEGGEEFTSPEYDTYDIALGHRDDIAGYEGVEYADVAEVQSR